MTRQISKGRCTFCHRELSKASMTRHLASCEQRTAMQREIESRQKAKKIKAFHLVYEDKGCLCDACAKQHVCSEKRLLLRVNSPRVGVCGYTGQNPAYNW